MTFHLARSLGKTVDELEMGEPRPMSNMEYHQWRAFFSWEAAMRDLARNG